MNSQWIRVTLDTAVSLPASNRTMGGAASHTCVPGSVLMGCAAAAIYGREDEDAATAFRLIQSGAVRFGDARPAVEQGGELAVALPTPKALHRPKAAGDDTLIAMNCPPDGSESGQMKPVSASWTLPDLQPVTVARELTMRTAMDATGRPVDAALYELTTLSAGQSFAARITADDAADLERVVDALCGRQRIGRKRQTEIGRVTIERIDAPAPVAEAPVADDVVTFVVLSPVGFRDADTGALRLEPTPADFGLPESARYVPERSFVRTDRFSWWNSKRGLPGHELLALSRGSVLTFHVPGGVDRAAVRAAVAGGVGARDLRICGGGEVLIDPKMLSKRVVSTGEAPGAAVECNVAIPDAPAPADDALFRRVQRVVGTRVARAEVRAAAVARGTEFARRMRVSAAQWGTIRNIARTARVQGVDLDELVKRVERHVGEGVASLADQWDWYSNDGPGRQIVIELKQNGGRSPATWLELAAEAAARAKAQDEAKNEGADR